MEKRPDFDEIKSYSEFSKYYWYRDELSKICRQLGIDYKGTKQELNLNIEEYFKGNLIKTDEHKQSTKSIAKSKIDMREVSLDCPLLLCGFSFNAKFREYFSKETGVENFKFTADMAAAFRNVKKENDLGFTIKDMLDVYHQKSNYAKYDNSSCEWNKFLKDFCADDENSVFNNKLKVASILWNVVRKSSTPKVYSHDLVEKYWDLIKEYC